MDKRDTHGLATLAGHRGAKIINDTAAHTIEASLIEFSSDAVVTTLKVTGSTDNIVGEYISTPANAVGGGGIAPENGGEFSEIQLSAGSCTYIK